MNARRNSGKGSRSGQPRKNVRGGSRPYGKGGARQGPRSGGAGRTGAIRRDDERRVSRPKSLGGSQIEGRQAVRELLLAQRRKVQEIWISSELEGDEALDDIVGLARANRVPVAYVARRRLETAARSEAPQGVLARAAEVPEVDLSRLISRRDGRAPFLIAVDGVTDPGNLGAIMRSCEGAGVDGIVVPRHRAVHITPTVAKAAAGAVEHVAVAVVPGLPAALSQMKDQGIWIVE